MKGTLLMRKRDKNIVSQWLITVKNLTFWALFIPTLITLFIAFPIIQTKLIIIPIIMCIFILASGMHVEGKIDGIKKTIPIAQAALSKYKQALQNIQVSLEDVKQDIKTVGVELSELEAISIHRATKSKRGPHNYSTQEKIDAVNDWEALDKDLHPITLEEWLENRFGTDYGVLRVAVSTFHSWRKLKKP